MPIEIKTEQPAEDIFGRIDETKLPTTSLPPAEGAELVEGEDKDKDKEPGTASFAGSISVTFPTTEEVWDFLPIETTRGKVELRWAYPSPTPGVRAIGHLNLIVDKYTVLLGLEGVIDLIEESLNRDCQNKWKQTVADCPDAAKRAEYFATLFHEGKTRDAITADGLARKSSSYRKQAMEEKTRNGGKLNEKVSELLKLAKDYGDRAVVQMQKDLEELGQP